ncbi:MAG: penicillin-binding protein 2 [Elusimicrobia bacterium RIFOXYB2_FULL_49_7]|nr:MAG: penicillin-binding protein 2 [Elusimicrobia bacterium RIFOXYB2_FULL_49_7]
MAAGKFLQENQFSRHAKRRALFITVAALFFVIASRLFYIQILKGDYFYSLSMENMMRQKIIQASRGLILDRNGVILARNRPAYAVSVLYHQVKDRQTLKRTLLQIRDQAGQRIFSEADLNRRFRLAAARRFEPICLADDVSIDVVTIVQEHLQDLPGIIVENETRREYPNKTLGCHFLGYLGEIPEEQFDSLKRYHYHFGDRMGIFGLEKQYESLVRGRDGEEYVMYDAYGREIERVKEMPVVHSEKGNDLYLTIDYRVQKAAEEAFPDSLSGAVVAIDPRNGDILAMLSSPRFDPNWFTLSVKSRTASWGKLVMDPSQPLNNRAVTGVYPPGSTFKLVTTSAALNEHVVGLDEHFKGCTGKFWFGNRPYGCWKKQGHGTVGMIQGVKVSCDVYFYQLGIKTGIDYMAQYARMFGFASKTGIDLPQEASGEVLDEETYNRKFQSRGWVWTKGQELNFSIGQGQTVTPIQLANYVGSLTSRQPLYRPHLFHHSTGPKGEIAQPTREVLHEIRLEDETRQMLYSALKAVMEPGGTGGLARVDSIIVGGKTGTAQNPQGQDHALFVATAPLNTPTIAIAVVVENAGHGGSVAAPIAGKILRTYFNR